MLSLLLYLFVVGIIAGYLARLLVPGRDAMSFGQTVILGIVGSFVGGLLASLISGGDFELGPAGIIGSIVGAVIALLIYNAVGGRSRSSAIRH